MPVIKKTKIKSSSALAKVRRNTKIKKAIKKVIKPKVKVRAKRKKKTPLDLIRGKTNPIISPDFHNLWESKATFNPSAIYADGKVHLVYRAIGYDDVSTLGYAKSKDGLKIDERYPEPIFYHRKKENLNSNLKHETPPILYSSGGGWSGGCEDPRLTLIGNRVYVLYTAFDGWGSVRIALSSISLSDFINNIWDWKEPVLISPPNELHKNWVLFPEKINGQYAILHGISPDIMVDYLENLDNFDGKTFIKSIHQHSPRWQLRDRGIRGVGPAPIKTKYGWLVLYHAMEASDPDRYKLFAMILDLKDPTKILYKSNTPILEPDESYENEGYKWGVVYSCGAIVKDGILFVYYGGADMVTAVATTNLDKFLEELVKDKGVKLKKKKLNE